MKANLEHSRHILLSKFASASHMSAMISEAEMPATSSDIRGHIKESATKAEKHQPSEDDVADLAYLLFLSLLSTSFTGITCCEKSLSRTGSLISVWGK